MYDGLSKQIQKYLNIHIVKCKMYSMSNLLTSMDYIRLKIKYKVKCNGFPFYK